VRQRRNGRTGRTGRTALQERGAAACTAWTLEFGGQRGAETLQGTKLHFHAPGISIVSSNHRIQMLVFLWFKNFVKTILLVG